MYFLPWKANQHISTCQKPTYSAPLWNLPRIVFWMCLHPLYASISRIRTVSQISLDTPWGVPFLYQVRKCLQNAKTNEQRVSSWVKELLNAWPTELWKSSGFPQRRDWNCSWEKAGCLAILARSPFLFLLHWKAMLSGSISHQGAINSVTYPSRAPSILWLKIPPVTSAFSSMSSLGRSGKKSQGEKSEVQSLRATY